MRRMKLYIKAAAEFPPLREYGDLPQIENGVGMIPQFMHNAKRVKIPQPGTKKRICYLYRRVLLPLSHKVYGKAEQGWDKHRGSTGGKHLLWKEHHGDRVALPEGT